MREGLTESRKRVYRIILDKAEPRKVYEKLSKEFGNVYSKFQNVNDFSFGILVSEKLSGRTWSDAAVVIIISGRKDATEIDITSAGGRGGLLRLDFGTHDTFIKKAVEVIEQKIKGNSLSWQTIESKYIE